MSEVVEREKQPLATLNSFQRDLLIVASTLEDPSGVDIRRALDDEYNTDNREDDTVEILSPRVCQTLDQLCWMGLVEKDANGGDGREHVYRVTDDGHRAVAAHWRWIGQRVLATTGGRSA